MEVQRTLFQRLHAGSAPRFPFLLAVEGGMVAQFPAEQDPEAPPAAAGTR